MQLRSLRKSLELTQQEVADAFNMSRENYCRYESGTRIPSLKTLIKMANYFSVSLDYLVGDDECIGETCISTKLQNGDIPSAEIKAYDNSLTGERIRALRKGHGLTQADIAKLRNVTQAAVAKQETGERSLGEEGLCWYAEYFSVSTDYLLGVIQEDELSESFLVYRGITMRLKELREKTNVSQKVLAEYIGCSTVVYSRYETGARMPPVDVLVKIAEFYTVSLDYLVLPLLFL